MSSEPYTLVFARRFVKDFEKLSRESQVRVRRALTELQRAPYTGRKLSGVNPGDGQYRWRVGETRIRYDIEGQDIRLLRVIKREDAYRK
jgi:mRNA interferase RelE/StbE